MGSDERDEDGAERSSSSHTSTITCVLKRSLSGLEDIVDKLHEGIVTTNYSSKPHTPVLVQANASIGKSHQGSPRRDPCQAC